MLADSAGSMSSFEPSNQIKITEDGLVELENGRKFRIKVSAGSSSKTLDSSARDLSELIVGVLNQSQDRHDVTYKDLNNTQIIYTGIYTDQKELHGSIFTPSQYEDTYTRINEMAIPIIQQPVGSEEETVDMGLPRSHLEVSFAEREVTHMEPTETVTINEVAKSTLVKVGDFFKKVGSKIKSGFLFVVNKVASLFRKTNGGVEETHEVFEERAKEFSWRSVSLKDIDQVMAKVVLRNGKPKVRDGVFRAGGRKKGLQSHVGTSRESINVMRQMLNKVQTRLAALSRNKPKKGEAVSHKAVTEASADLETIESIIKSIDLGGSEWCHGVMASDATSSRTLGKVKKMLLELKGAYHIAREAVENLDPIQKFKLLFNNEELTFRKQYLANYRVYSTTEEFFTELKVQYARRAVIAQKAFEAVPDANGNITIEVSGREFTKNKAKLLEKVRNEQHGILSLIKEWLADPFINNGECQHDNDIYRMIVSIAAFANQDPDNFHEHELREIAKLMLNSSGAPFAPHVAAGSLQSERKEGLTAAILAIGNGDKEGREALLSQMAEDISKTDQYLLSQITSSEFARKNWEKDGKEVKAPGILAMTEQFNKLSDYVKFCIIGLTAVEAGEEDTTLENRARIKEFFIDLLDKVIKKNDYHGAMAILSAMSDASVNRLKDTDDKVSKKHTKRLEKAEARLSPYQNYKVQRLEYKKLARAGAPYVPYLGTFLTDYTFIYDAAGNPKTTEDGKLVMETLELLSKPIDAIKNSQSATAEKATANPRYFKTQYDCLEEVEGLKARATGILERLDIGSAAMAAQTAEPDKKFADVLYDLSLLIQPRKPRN